MTRRDETMYSASVDTLFLVPAESEIVHYFQPPRADLMPSSEGKDYCVRPYILEDF